LATHVRAYRLTDTGQAEMVDVAPARPGAGEVVLRVLAAGVCGTDLSLLRNRSRGLELPVTLGHEIVGEVIDHGEGVHGPGRGTLVAVYELLGCGSCAACDRAQDNLCRNIVPGAIGITTDGGMAEQVVVPARNLVALGRLDPVQAAPLTDAGLTALHAVEHGRRVLERGSTAVVVGVGGLGHLAVQFLRATSEARILAVDVDRARLDFAADIGADDGVLAGPDAAAEVVAANGGHRIDAVFDFVGSQESLDLAARAARRGGTIVVTGGGGGRLSITAEMGAGRAPDREVTMVHTFGGTRDDLVRALALAEAGRVSTHTQAYALDDAPRALGDLDAGRVLGRAVLVP
jgi:propanol-preferring alcohol dehydrogenase